MENAINLFILIERNRKSTLIFAINVAHVYGLAKSFKDITGISPKIITGKTETFERAQTLADFAAGHIPVIINCGVLTEGTDLPRTDCVLLARPTCNSSLYIQMVGRGLRTHPDKSDCLVLDVIDKMKSPKRSLITFPTLLAAQELKGTSQAKEPVETRDKKDRRIEELNFDAVRVKINTSKLSTINLESERLAWVKIPSYPIHVLECTEFRIILMEEATNTTDKSIATKYLFTAVVTAKRHEGEEGFKGFEKIPSHSYKLTIAKSMEITSILNEIDNFISNYEKSNGVSLGTGVLRSSYWRKSFQPSQKQLSIILKAAKKFKATDVEIRGIFKATKGQAANAITRINFLQTMKCPIQHTWADIFN